MISRHTCNVPKDVILPRLLYRDTCCFQACRWRSQVLPDLSSTLPGWCLALPDILSRLPDLSLAVPDMFLALPDLPLALPDLSLALPDLSSVLPGLMPAHPGLTLVHQKLFPALPAVLKLITITPMALLYESSQTPDPQ
jgi:hypothetical protein